MEFLSPIFIILVAWLAFSAWSQRFDEEERRFATWSFALHAAMAFVHVFVTRNILGGGDMFWYHRDGGRLADLILSDFGQYAPEVTKLALGLTADLPFWIHGAVGGAATGSMFGISGWILLFTGKSLYGACALLSMLNFFSRLLAWRVFKPIVPAEARRWGLLAILLVPSALFWTGGLLKESVALTGFGLMVAGAGRVALKGDFVFGLLLFALGAFPAYLVKPYVLFPMIPAMALWYFAAQSLKGSVGAALTVTPFRLVLAGVLAFAGISLLSSLVPSYSLETISDELASVQTAGQNVSGDTNYSLVSAAPERGLAGQLAYAPLALFFALTRPWFFEARSVQILVNAMETTLLLLLLLRMPFTIGVRGIIRGVLSSPLLLFALTYVVIFGTAVGLGSTNVGSLSRYRVPMMPLFAMFVVLLPVYARRNARFVEGETITAAAQEEPEQARTKGSLRGVPGLTIRARRRNAERNIGRARRLAGDWRPARARRSAGQRVRS